MNQERPWQKNVWVNLLTILKRFSAGWCRTPLFRLNLHGAAVPAAEIIAILVGLLLSRLANRSRCLILSTSRTRPSVCYAAPLTLTTLFNEGDAHAVITSIHLVAKEESTFSIPTLPCVAHRAFSGFIDLFALQRGLHVASILDDSGGKSHSK